MSKDTLIKWKEECDAIHSEMDRLLTAGWLETAEERQVRKIQFMALIERRDVSARNFLRMDGGATRHAMKLKDIPESPRRSNVDTANKIKITPEEAIPEHRDTPGAAEPNLQAPAGDPRLGAKNFLKFLRLEKGV